MHQQGPNSDIFSKAKEFGADESRFQEKLSKVDNLLYNYNGLNNMKDDFAKMLYASSSKIFVSKKGS